MSARTKPQPEAPTVEPTATLISALRLRAEKIKEAKDVVAKAKRNHQKVGTYWTDIAGEDPKEALLIAKGLASGELSIRDVECEVEITAHLKVVDGRGKSVGRAVGTLDLEGTYLEALGADELDDLRADGELPFDHMRGMSFVSPAEDQRRLLG